MIYYITINNIDRYCWEETEALSQTEAKRLCSKKYAGLRGTLAVGLDFGGDYVETIATRRTSERRWKSAL